ncbi:hypothetical protein HWV62_14308 [Athelia sp. TMB]|nr:hypothetical protein HWV62_14308 [Athelia sp. TMB]
MNMFKARTTYTRILSFLGVLSIAWIWLVVEEILPSPGAAFTQPSSVSLQNHAISVTCDAAASAPTSALLSVPSSAPHLEPLSQKIFPISSHVDGTKWIGENNVMLRALLRCMELDDCPAVQKKDLVIAIIAEGDEIETCWHDENNCLLSERNPYGLPAWKLFTFHFWTYAAHPLGHNWTLSPEPYMIDGFTANQYLGYSVEPSCMTQDIIPLEQRRDQAYVLSKRLTYLAENDHTWPSHFYEAAVNATGIEFVLGANDEHGSAKVPVGITNHGVLDQKEFLKAVSQSLVLVGVGTPVNSVIQWDKEHPEDRQAWSAQHSMLKFLDPPYVYNVFEGDLVGFIEAIEDAVANPIEGHILDRMRMSSIEERLRIILETDWRAQAADLLENWKETKGGRQFTL